MVHGNARAATRATTRTARNPGRGSADGTNNPVGATAAEGNAVARLYSSKVKMAASPKAAARKVTVRAKAATVGPSASSRNGGKASGAKAAVRLLAPPTTRSRAKNAKTAAPPAAETAKPASGSSAAGGVPSAAAPPEAEKVTAAVTPTVAMAEAEPARGTTPARMDYVQNTVQAAKKLTQPAVALLSSAQLARVSELLPESDLTTIGNLPEGFMGFEAAIAPIIEAPEGGRSATAAGPSRAPTIQERFARCCEEASAPHRESIGKMKQGTGSIFRLADDAGERFFVEEGAKHGTRTNNHQCDTPGCSDQGCCPIEYNFSSIVTHAALLAKDFPAHGHVFVNGTFKRFVKAGTSRQQTNGRFSLPAPPILLPDAEVIAAEGYATEEQDCADYDRATTMATRAKAARQACSNAQCLAIFATDLSTGKRTADITAALTADVYRTGVTPVRRISVYHKTSKARPFVS